MVTAILFIFLSLLAEQQEPEISLFPLGELTSIKDNKPWADLSDAGTVAAVTNLNDPSGTDVSVPSVIDRWWDIYTFGAEVTANATFSYRGDENTTAEPLTEIAVQHWNGTYWDDGNSGGNGTYTATGTMGINTTDVAGSVTTQTVLTEFSPYVLVLKSDPLPIELLNFTASCKNQNILVTWSTASETNNNYFTLERSVDAQEWEAIATINGMGNSNTLVNYNYTDTNSYNDIVYYRLKQTDFDGAYTYSDIITASCQNKSIEIVNIYPNPASGCFDYIIYSTEKNEEVFVTVINLLGKVIINKKENITKGLYNVYY